MPRTASAASDDLPALARTKKRRRPCLQHAASVTGPFLDITALSVRFGGLVAFNEVALSVPERHIVAIIGPNGSGKSTLFNAVTGLVPADGGTIRLQGAEIGGLSPHRALGRGMARTFQNLRVFPNLTVIENVMIGMHARLDTGALGALLRLGPVRREAAALIRHAYLGEIAAES
jgi:branched-chain amino acid transport system permease protein